MTEQTSTPRRRKPKAILMDAPAHSDTGSTKADSPRKPRAQGDLSRLVEIPDDVANGLEAELTPPPLNVIEKKRFSLRALLFASLGGLISLAIGLWIDALVNDLFARNTWLGWIAVGLTLLFVAALLAVVAREMFGLFRIRKINALRDKCNEALESADLKTTRKIVLEVVDLCEKLPLTARGREVMKENANQVMEPTDLLLLTERSLMSPLDKQAKTLVLNSSKRVSIVTAISPRALVDVLYVLMENFRLIRALSELYGGRPGTYGLLRLTRMIITHLAATGAVAIGDGLLQQFIGHGLAAKLSSRLGEGVINGLLTARIGISAMDICRPMPFHENPRPGISDFLQEITRLDRSKDSV